MALQQYGLEGIDWDSQAVVRRGDDEMDWFEIKIGTRLGSPMSQWLSVSINFGHGVRKEAVQKVRMPKQLLLLCKCASRLGDPT